MITGLTSQEAATRLEQYGPNALPEPGADPVWRIFLRQFKSSLIYILLAAAAVSLLLEDTEDAIFIGAVLLINGIIGTLQEYSASRSAAALRNLEQLRASVIRDGERREIAARDLVPGDIVLLEAGARIPADLKLIEVTDLRCDESLLTGESVPMRKRTISEGGDPEDKTTRAYAGTMAVRGRAVAEVVATGLTTQFGRIAESVAQRPAARAPLLVRLEQFSKRLAIAVLAAAVLLVGAGLLRGMALGELFMVAVGLAVSAIPEGLPVAITVALAIAMRRMASHNVITRNMPAIEALGSCTVIATDKTGTLTVNELTVTDVVLPDGTSVSFEDRPDLLTIEEEPPLDHRSEQARGKIAPLLRAAILPNEASLVRDGEDWLGQGDTVDIALLQAARKGGMQHEDLEQSHPLISRIPYESDLKYAASFHDGERHVRIFVKGAPETLIDMADSMRIEEGEQPIDRDWLLSQKDIMAARGLRVLAFAEGQLERNAIDGELGHAHLSKLVFLGFAGMKDPIRPEVPAAIAAAGKAGIEVVMVTGDDPITAAAIAADAGLKATAEEVVSGQTLKVAEAQGPAAVDALTRTARIYARVEPLQKLVIVESLARNGHVVAVTGDGVNDAPALAHAHVGVAMGRKGTDIARESADIILTDDNFASIVAGIREGRVAYSNIRKVVFMLVATGAAEVLLFLLAVPLGFPMPLVAVQLLWLNLVTNGIQDVALATERAEGDELSAPPRKPGETLFDRIMTVRILLAAGFMSTCAFGLLYWEISAGASIGETRNLLLLLFVLFENVMTLSARSERNTIFSRAFFANPFLLVGVAGAQLLHIAAMYVPVLSDTLAIAPVSLAQWGLLLVPALALLALLEVEKSLRRRAAAKERR